MQKPNSHSINIYCKATHYKVDHYSGTYEACKHHFASHYSRDAFAAMFVGTAENVEWQKQSDAAMKQAAGVEKAQ